MPVRLGPRFALEAIFLIALGVGAGFADLAPRWIVLVMAAGWLLVALFELATYRLLTTLPPIRRGYYPPPAVAVAEPVPAGPVRELDEATVIVAHEPGAVSARGPT